jgi:hypothetical protein
MILSDVFFQFLVVVKVVQQRTMMFERSSEQGLEMYILEAYSTSRYFVQLPCDL